MLVLVAVALLAGAAGYQWGRSRPEAAPPSPALPTTPEPAVAQWTGGRLTAAQLQQRVVALKTSAGLVSLDAARARAFADAVVQTALLATEARSRGLENDARVQGPLADLLARRLVELDVEDPKQRPAPSEAEVTASYEAHREDFLRPERIRLTVLQVRAPKGDARARVKAKTELETLQRQLSGLTPAAVSQALAKRAGGTLGALTLPELEARLGTEAAQAAWQVMSLERLELLETADAVLLVRLEGRDPGRTLTRDQAREQIESRLWYEHRDEVLKHYREALAGRLKLKVDEAALQQALSETR